MTSHLCFLLLITKVMGPLLFSPLFAQCFIEPWKIGVNQKIATSAFSLSVSVSLSPLSSSRSQAESHYERVDCNTLLHWHQPVSICFYYCTRGEGSLIWNKLRYQQLIKISHQSWGWWICLSGVYQALWKCRSILREEFENPLSRRPANYSLLSSCQEIWISENILPPQPVLGVGVVLGMSE